MFFSMFSFLFGFSIGGIFHFLTIIDFRKFTHKLKITFSDFKTSIKFMNIKYSKNSKNV